MPRIASVPSAVAVVAAILGAAALFAGSPASACVTDIEGRCDGWSPVPPLPAEGEYELIGDLPASGGVALALWSGGPSSALVREAERRGCAVSAAYANDPAGGLSSVTFTSSRVLPASSPVLVECAPRLVGRVLGADGEPPGIVHVGVYDIVDGRGSGFLTAADGSFTLDPPYRGTFVLAVGLHGRDGMLGPIGWYGPGGFTMERDRAKELTVGRTGAEVEIRLPALATISGVVLGPDGKPRDKVIVDAEGRGWLRTSDMTASDGTFAMRAVAGERVVLAVSGLAPPGEAGNRATGVGGTWNSVGWYGPDGFTTERGRATPVTSGGPDGSGIEIRLPTTRTVGGTVTVHADKGPVAVGEAARGPGGEQGRLLVRVYNGGINRFGELAADGSFVVMAPAGRAEVAVAVASSWFPWSIIGWHGPGGLTTDRRRAASALLLDADVTDLDVRMPAIRWVRGVLRQPDGDEYPCCLYIMLRALAGDGQWNYLGRAYADEDGSFGIPAIDGVYALDLHFHDWAWTPVAVHDVEGGVTWACGPLVPFEVDGADVTGVEITLPGVPREGHDCP